MSNLLQPQKLNIRFGRWLLAPMLLLSLGVHAAVLMIPVGASREAALAPPDPEADTIAITRVPPPGSQNRPAALQLAASTPLARVAPAPSSAQKPAPTSTRPAGDSNSTSSPAPAQPQPARPRASSEPHRSTVSSLPPASPGTGSLPSSTPLRTPLERPPFNPAIHQRLLAYADTLTQPQAQLNQLALWIAQQYTYNVENTSREAYNKNLDSWISEVRKASGQSNLWNDELEQPLTVKHHRRVCMAPEPEAPVVGVVVSPAGVVQGEPTLLQSTGYAFLNRAVLAAVKQHNFPQDEEQKAYTVDVAVQVDYGEQDCLEPYSQPSASAQVNPRG